MSRQDGQGRAKLRSSPLLLQMACECADYEMGKEADEAAPMIVQEEQTVLMRGRQLFIWP